MPAIDPSQIQWDNTAGIEPSQVQWDSQSTPTQASVWDMGPGNTAHQFAVGMLRPIAEGILNIPAQAAGGWRALWDLARGKSGDQALADLQSTENKFSVSLGQPTTPAQQAGARVAALPGRAMEWASNELGKGAQALGAGPVTTGLVESIPQAVPLLAGLGKISFGSEPYSVAAENTETPEAVAAGEAAAPAASVESTPPAEAAPPVEGGMDEAAQTVRRQILNRVGITDARDSAIEGNAQDAATDYQLSKTDEPAGRAMAAQIESERGAMVNFAQDLIQRSGGSIGLTEDDLINRGQTIAAPFDGLQNWFKQRTQEMYAQAQQRSEELAANGNPTAYTQLQSVDQLLQNPSFRNTLLAKDQGSLLSSVQAQLQHFRQSNPIGFTPAGAEQFRQWLNQVWTPQNKWAIGQIKSAVDNDVLTTAGEDIYQQARAVAQARAATLEDPKGIAQLFDTDPQTPINRVTPLEKIPDRILSLPAEQFQNLAQTLQNMPPELQPQAQAAMGEIRGQLLNRLLKAGSQTRSGRAAQVWHGQDVANVLGQLSNKFAVAFQGLPKLQSAISDMNAAGHILHINESYPGAFAQASNLSRRGIGASILAQGARALGASVGSMAGPYGAAAGEIAGNAAGAKLAEGMAEARALKAVRNRISSTVPP